MSFEGWKAIRPEETDIQAADGSIAGIISRALNFVDPRLVQHGSRVAQLVHSFLISRGQYDRKQIRDICFTALLHDIGAYKTEEIDRMVSFEAEQVWAHSVYGSLFIRHFSPLSQYADAVLFHHTSWEILREMKEVGAETVWLAQTINLADRIDMFFQRGEGTEAELKRRIGAAGGRRFMPEIAEMALAMDFSGWEDGAGLQEGGRNGGAEFPHHVEFFSREEIVEYLQMLVFAIDFRSHYTVTHTITTTGVSMETAKRLGMNREEIRCVALGALLHDLGKIGIPIDILEFSGPLNGEQMAVMRTHVDLTEQILGQTVSQTVKRIALRHHEKLDGSGYPGGLKAAELTRADRIVAVADIVSALNGQRSYKEAFPKEKTLDILAEMSGQGLLDGDIVALICAEFDSIMEAVGIMCGPVVEAYRFVNGEYERLLEKYSGEGIS
ncbi:HD-GYP domain-containing protein [Bacilliculturomica massiliensis]|uniref:HD-GYP domain-containing protein n=1 Tax=Bacilliculturomica massiliensis TaxID=1917867 RepID=UPI00102F9CB8|nr:HD domain-containing phosphohydrolase [Bacilliculturomica massiliensis]